MARKAAGEARRPTKKESPAKKRRGGRFLVIVESPAKAKTIGRYLGEGYDVRACKGHVRDLPKKRLGVDIERGFEPEYVILKEKGIPALRRAAASAEAVYLAPDLDREGEAIAWHLSEALELSEDRAFRVTFNEITKEAILRAFEKPGRIDSNKVDAQQARRILDRVVGYQLSPLLWKKVAKGLSAGRVQSVAVRLIVDREREIRAFKPEEYWKLTARLRPAAGGPEFEALFAGRLIAAASARCPACGGEMRPAEVMGETVLRCQKESCKTSLRLLEDGRAVEPVRLGDEASAKAAVEKLSGADWRVADLRERDSTARPKPPFTTSTLQQAAATRLGWAAERTMRIAQQLYEGVAVAGESVGLITYMRTDSVRLAESAVAECRELIRSEFGADYLPAGPAHYRSKGRSQGAHEAVRTTSAARRPDDVRPYLTQEQFKLYELIWRRYVACQMSPARFRDTTITAEAAELVFRATGRRTLFPGCLAAYPSASKEEAQELPKVAPGDGLVRADLQPSQHFTQPPPRYTEASLVKTLERDGIGRPSTYATIISTIQRRGYVRKDRGAFNATELAEVVTDKLLGFFPELMDVSFTAKMEDELDRIEEGACPWRSVLQEFYTPFSADLEKAMSDMESAKGRRPEKDIPCPECGKPMLVRYSKSGKFLGCSGFPECRVTMPLDGDAEAPLELSDEAKAAKCGLCGAPMALRTGRRGPFLACTKYPDCRFTMDLDSGGNIRKQEVSNEKCELCGKPMLVRSGRRGSFLGCSGYPECRNTKPLPKGDGEGGDGAGAAAPGARRGGRPGRSGRPAPKKTDIDCPECGKKLVVRSGRRGKFLGCSGYPDCRHTQDLPEGME